VLSTPKKEFIQTKSREDIWIWRIKMTMMGINKQGITATITGTVHHLVDFRETDKPSCYSAAEELFN
jgi:hypothetical protein